MKRGGLGAVYIPLPLGSREGRILPVHPTHTPHSVPTTHHSPLLVFSKPNTRVFATSTANQPNKAFISVINMTSIPSATSFVSSSFEVGYLLLLYDDVN